MPFTHKQIAVTFDLGTGDFGEGGLNRLKLTGPLRASANIMENGGPAWSTLDLTLNGMTLDHMNRLSTLGQKITVVRRNVVTVEAGDTANGLSVVYEGQIIEAWADFAGMPDAAFHVVGGVGHLQAVKPIPPTTYNGLVDVSTILRSLATQAGLAFNNYGVTSHFIDPYYPGTVWDQIKACAEHANIEWIMTAKALIIWPKGGARGEDVAVVSADTGMIGYPRFAQSAIQITMIYTPSIGYGQRIRVKSSLINGDYIIQTMSHQLESETPGGMWHTRITALPPGLAATGDGPLPR